MGNPSKLAHRLSVVIPTYNGLAVLAPCLRSVERYAPNGTEIIVVDDGSRDGTLDWLRRTHPAVRVVAFEQNRGFCAAVNAGIRAARAPVIETLNNDTVVAPGWADHPLELFREPEVGSVAPLVWLARGEGLIDSAGDEYHISGWALNRAHFEPFTPELSTPREVFGTCASAGFYRREAVLRAGGFPEHFSAYYDDVDLAFRLRWSGYRCVYTPRSQVFHRLNYSHNHKDPSLIHRLALNEERVFWTDLPNVLRRHGLLLHAMFVAYTAMTRAVRRDNFWPYLRGKLAVMSERGQIRRQRACLDRLRAEAAGPVRFPVTTGSGQLAARFLRGLMSFLGMRRALGASVTAKTPAAPAAWTTNPADSPPPGIAA
jgi:GT2 family glycosyltransferase